MTPKLNANRHASVLRNIFVFPSVVRIGSIDSVQHTTGHRGSTEFDRNWAKGLFRGHQLSGFAPPLWWLPPDSLLCSVGEIADAALHRPVPKNSRSPIGEANSKPAMSGVSKGESSLRRAARVPDQVRSARLTHPRAATTIWSRTWMPISSPARLSRSVTLRSSLLGVGSPDG